MGAYAKLRIDGYPIIISKSDVIPEVMTIFRETDRKEYHAKLSEDMTDDDYDAELERASYIYANMVSVITQRLDIMGFSMTGARNDYEAKRSAEIASYEPTDEEPDPWIPDELPVLRDMTFDKYLDTLRTILANRKRLNPLSEPPSDIDSPAIRFVLAHDNDYLMGFLGSDLRFLIRIVCELVPEDAMVVQDVTDLVLSGYCDEDEALCDQAIQSLTVNHPQNARIVVLTEGATDAWILESSLRLLFPHLVDYYTFLDFDMSRAPGGAGHLVSLVKGFAAAGISNRTIAIFDNDTAAWEALRSLNLVSLPASIAILTLPELEILKSYPTIGPSGLGLLDVNGLAASIELYLGPDVLEDATYKYSPVQWRGYCEALSRYQGEVMNKDRLHTAFKEKLASCESNAEMLDQTDWSGLSAVLEKMFQAFV